MAMSAHSCPSSPRAMTKRASASVADGVSEKSYRCHVPPMPPISWRQYSRMPSALCRATTALVAVPFR